MKGTGNKRIRAGVVGVGHLGAIHTRLWSLNPGADLVGVYDVEPERRTRVASEFGVRAFESYEELLDSVDAISLVTPTSTHAALAYVALQRDKHCFVEKPITARSDEARRLIEEANSRGLVLQVGHVERFNPAVLAVDHALVDPMFIESHRLSQFRPRATDVAVVLDLMIHDIDLVLHFVRGNVRDVRASGVSVVSDTIDIANARIEFDNGCVANLTASRISQRPMRKMRLFRRDAYISIDFALPAVEIFRIADGEESDPRASMLLGAIDQGSRRRSILYEQPVLEQINAISQELEGFTAAIRAGTAPPVTGDEGAEALRVAEMIIARIDASAELVARP